MENYKYGYVYITENLINGKKYIGKREKSYFDTSYIGSGTALEKAIKKYGKENFKCAIIEWCSSKEELSSREEYWISFYNAVKDPNFYNITPLSTGLPSGFKYSEEIKQKMRKPHPNAQGKKRSQETKDKMSNSRKGKPNIKLRGQKFSEETKLKISQNAKGKKKPGVSIANSKRLKGKPRSQEAIEKQKETIANNPNWGGNKGHKQSDFQKSQMSKARTGQVRSEEEIEKMKDTLSQNNKVQNLNTGEVFGTALDAERFYNNGRTNNGLSSAIFKNQKYCGCFWVKLGDKEPLDESQRLQQLLKIKEELNSKNKNYNCKKIICITTGEIFDSIKDANLKLGTKYTSLKVMKDHHAKGMEWDEYVE